MYKIIIRDQLSTTHRIHGAGGAPHFERGCKRNVRLAKSNECVAVFLSVTELVHFDELVPVPLLYVIKMHRMRAGVASS